jgi:hypothetical protein
MMSYTIPQEGRTAWEVELANGKKWFSWKNPTQEMFESEIVKVWCYTGVCHASEGDLPETAG